MVKHSNGGLMKFCKQPGCPALVERGYCPEHKPKSTKKADPFYVSKEWRRFQKWFISRHPLCTECGQVGRHVHHIREIKAGGEPLAESNCRTLCAACHNKRHGNRAAGKLYSYETMHREPEYGVQFYF